MKKTINNTIIAFQALLLLPALSTSLIAQHVNVDNTVINIGTGYFISTGGSMLIQNSGAIDNSGTLKIPGNWTNNANGLINASPGTVELNGTTVQTIGGSVVTTFNNLTINNSNGILLAGNIIVNGTLTFTSGKITTGANYVILGSSASIVGAGAGQYVNGNLRRFIPATANAVVNFDIGDAVNYTPVQLTFTGTPSGASSIDAATSIAAPPVASGISQTEYVNRQWNLTNNGVTGFTSYNAIFNFVAGDIIGGANTANFIAANYNAPNWTLPAVGTKTSTSTEITGATAFGTFAIGTAAIVCSNPTLPSLSATAITNCGTQSTTLSIASGALNDATDWQWYSGTCGGTAVGSGTSVSVSPAVTTTYYVRGEGGCVSTGACASITITVETPVNWYLDADNDGYYLGSPISACASPGVGYNTTATVSGDCDDSDINTYQNLNGYVDVDGDGYTIGAITSVCSGVSLPSGYSATSAGTDCNDNDISVYELPVASVISASGATTFCSGGNVTLSGNNGGVWSTNETSATINVTATGDYYVTNTNSCGSVESNHISVTVNPLPSLGISATGSTALCPTGSVILSSSQTSGNSWSTGATSQSITINSIGTFTVTYTDGNTCSATASISTTASTNCVPATQMNNGVCGTLNYVRTSAIGCVAVSGATQYEWQFSNISGVFATKTTTTNYVLLHSVTPALNWGTNWNIKVRTKIGTNVGPYSADCAIGIMPDPSINGVPQTQLRTVDCNKQNYRINADNRIIANPITGANQYEFEFSSAITGLVVATKLVQYNVMFLNTVTPALVYPAQYNVRVRARIGTTWGVFGTPCLIGIIGLNKDEEGIADTEIDLTEEAVISTSYFDMLVMPNPFNEQANLMIKSDANEQVNVEVFDMIGNIVWKQLVTSNTNVNFGIEMAQGTYVVKAMNSKGEQAMFRFIKSK